MNQQENTNPIDDDTEAHLARVKADAEAAEGDDDVEGHRWASSDRNIKDEVEPVAWEDDDDVEGHRYHNSDRNIKDEVEPVVWEADSATTGQDTEAQAGKS